MRTAKHGTDLVFGEGGVFGATYIEENPVGGMQDVDLAVGATELLAVNAAQEAHITSVGAPGATMIEAS